MKHTATHIVSADDPNSIDLAAKLLRDGQLVAIPTETVYGLAADALNPRAVRQIFAVKGRAGDNPLIVHVCSIDMWRELIETLPEQALVLAKAFWPGPLTIVLPKSSRVCDDVTAGLVSVAVRMPAHSAALSVIEKAGLALAAPSSNISGGVSPTSAEHCMADLAGKIPLILDGGPCPVGIESTVLSLERMPTLLRPGAVTQEQISAALGMPVVLSPALNRPLLSGEAALSPGMKYRHYSPAAKLFLLKGPLDLFLERLESAPHGTMGLVFEGEQSMTSVPCVAFGSIDDPKAQAHLLFASLRRLDIMGARQIYARCPKCNGESLGVYNRLLRAAAFEVVEL
jgi:L-threonylcarbamoyladenylate synthase